MDDGFRVLLQLPAFPGWLDIVTYPAEQAHAKRLFQLADAGTDCRLGDAKLVCGPAEMAVSGHREKGAQQLNIHPVPPLDKRMQS